MSQNARESNRRCSSWRARSPPAGRPAFGVDLDLTRGRGVGMMPPGMVGLMRTYGLSLGAGALLALAFPSWNLHLLAWVVPAVLFWRVRGLRAGGAAAQFFAAGWAFHTVLLQWLLTNVYWAGGYAALGYQGLCLLLACFWGGMGAVWVWTRSRAPQLAGPLGLAVLWAAMEFLEARLFTGFGWSALAYSQGPNLRLLQWAAIGGTPLVAMILVTFNALLAQAAAERAWRVPRLLGAVLLAAATHLAGGVLLRDTPYPKTPMLVGIVQTGFPQDMKYGGHYEEQLVQEAIDLSGRLRSQGRLDLLVWPEATVLESFDREPYRRALTQLAKDMEAHVFAGAVREEGGRSFNSSVLISPEGEFLGHYDKVHLAPFGEYMPFDQFFPFLRQIVPVDVDAGTDQRVLPMRNFKVGPLICFEVLFAPMAERLCEMGADMLAVVTNLGWFGMSNAASQELELARLRAIETRLPVIHAANTGLSGVFDPYGRFTPMHERYTALQTLGRQCIRTFPLAAPETRPLGRLPALFPWAAAILGACLPIAAFLVSRMRGKTVKSGTGAAAK